MLDCSMVGNEVFGISNMKFVMNGCFLLVVRGGFNDEI